MAEPVNTELWKQYNGKGFAAEYSEYSERANKDVNGNELSLTIESDKVTAIGGKTISAETQIPIPQEDDKVILSKDGNASWHQLSKSSWGTALTDSEGTYLTDENGNVLFDENKVDLWSTLDNDGIGAERALADVAGNPLALTIESDRVTAIGSKPIGVGVEMTTSEVTQVVDQCDMPDYAPEI